MANFSDTVILSAFKDPLFGARFSTIFKTFKALNGLLCADVPLRNYSLTHFTISVFISRVKGNFLLIVL